MVGNRLRVQYRGRDGTRVRCGNRVMGRVGAG